ncbi:MAG: hypothetical protein A2041_07885 [Bacteroidetes bacterium GWA2_31_9b]|nr:MAG: hypothetical protein A2041_07885 [Bacteroidetes bacterium GWA2_31_9b]
MKAPILIITFQIIFLSNLFAQSAVIRNINLYYKDQKAIINYDLKDFKPNKNHNIELFFVDDNFNVKVPKKLFGDFGDSISTGKNKQIQWALFEDNINIANTLKPVILVDGLNKGGSNNIILSILVPGLGDYFVENPRNMIYKPYLRTLTVIGALTLGYIADQNRVKLVWKKWDSKINDEVGYLYDNDYWLFSFDKEIFYFVGISVWLMDVIWVYAKGNENEKLKLFTNYYPSISYKNGIANLGININL